MSLYYSIVAITRTNFVPRNSSSYGDSTVYIFKLEWRATNIGMTTDKPEVRQTANLQGFKIFRVANS